MASLPTDDATLPPPDPGAATPARVGAVDATLPAPASTPALAVDATLPAPASAPARIGAADVTLPAPPPAPDVVDHPSLVPVERDHYALGPELARGGMGRIVVARDRRLRRKVAVKELVGDARSLGTRFEREALITARLQHPSIVRVYEAGRWPDGKAFYAMELVDGRPLLEVIRAAR